MVTVTPVIPPRVALPPRVRAVIYQVYAGLGLLVGATQVGYSAADLGQPVWLVVVLAVYAFLGLGLGITAASNTDVTPPLYEAPVPARARDDDGDGVPDVAPYLDEDEPGGFGVERYPSNN